jgi:hypothetical protein
MVCNIRFRHVGFSFIFVVSLSKWLKCLCCNPFRCFWAEYKFRGSRDDMMPPLNWRRDLRQVTIIMVKADERVIRTMKVSGSLRKGAERFEFCIGEAMN